MPGWIIPAASAAYGIVSGAIAGGKDKRQIRQQEKLNDLQVNAQERLNEYNMGLQLQQWKDTGPTGQMEQLKKAGLNPALLYGMGGAGGATTGTAGGSVQGANAPSGSGRETEEFMSMGLQAIQQMELLEAQKENIKADTENKKQETQVKIAEVGKTYAEGEKITQEAKLITETFEAKVQQILGESQSAWTKGKVDTNTVNEQIQQKIDSALQISLENANISQDTAQKVAEIAQKWKGLDLEERKTAVLELTGGEQKDQDQIINVINSIVHIISRGFLGGHKK